MRGVGESIELGSAPMQPGLEPCIERCDDGLHYDDRGPLGSSALDERDRRPADTGNPGHIGLGGAAVSDE